MWRYVGKRLCQDERWMGTLLKKTIVNKIHHLGNGTLALKYLLEKLCKILSLKMAWFYDK